MQKKLRISTFQAIPLHKISSLYGHRLTYFNKLKILKKAQKIGLVQSTFFSFKIEAVANKVRQSETMNKSEKALEPKTEKILPIQIGIGF